MKCFTHPAPLPVLVLVTLVTLLASTRALRAAAQDTDLDDTIGRGLDYLAAQQAVDGSFTDTGPKIAITSLGLLDYLAAGNVPDLGKYGGTVRAAIDFLVQQAPPDGYYGKIDGSRMYGQAITTLALAEAWGIEENAARRAKIRDIVQKGSKVLIDAQKVNKSPDFAGGWRYEPQAADSDISLSGWCALALRACSAAGVAVPRESAEQAIGFVLKCRRGEGGFSYQPNSGASLISATGTAVVCLALLDGSKRPERDEGMKFLREHAVDDQTPFPYYSMYYAAQAAVQEGDSASASVTAPIMRRLAKLQGPDGSWPQSRSGEEPGVTYATTVALLTLEAPYRLLPVYQR